MADFLTLLGFLGEGDVIAFSAAVGLVFLIGLLEGLGTLVGFGFMAVSDALTPDVDLDVDSPDLSAGAVSELMSWLRINQVPAIIVLIAYLTIFGIAGIAAQLLSAQLIGTTIPGLIAVPAIAIGCIPSLRYTIGIFSSIFPRDESNAVSRASFIGTIGTVTVGTARLGSPAQVRLEDEHGQPHYIMLEPDRKEVAFQQGASVLIVRRKTQSLFIGIEPPDSLID